MKQKRFPSKEEGQLREQYGKSGADGEVFDSAAMGKLS